MTQTPAVVKRRQHGLLRCCQVRVERTDAHALVVVRVVLVVCQIAAMYTASQPEAEAIHLEWEG